jgi:hypothetical protein
MSTAPAHTLLTSVCALMVCVGGCSSKNAAGEITVVDGCMVDIRGISIDQAAEIVKTWDFGDDCELKVNSESGEGAID